MSLNRFVKLSSPSFRQKTTNLSEQNRHIIMLMQRRINMYKGVNSSEDKVECANANNTMQHWTQPWLDNAKTKGHNNHQHTGEGTLNSFDRGWNEVLMAYSFLE